MRKYALIGLLALLTIHLFAQGYDQWNYPRFSGVQEDDTIMIRCEASLQTMVLNLVEGEVNETNMIQNGPGIETFSANVPAPAGDDKYFGFRIVGENENFALPVYYPLADMPPASRITKLADDDPDDSLLDDANMEIVADYATFSNNHLIASIENAGGGFPTSAGWTFFTYSFGILNPLDPETFPVFAMVYTVNQPGIMQPGLYKMVGDSGLDDMIMIGDIVTEVDAANNRLSMYCDWQDLLDDDDFTSWFDLENPHILCGSMTAEYSITQGMVNADNGIGTHLYPRAFIIEPFTNTMPQLTDIHLIQEGEQAYIELNYSDAESNFPILAEVEAEGVTRSFYPMSYDYTETVAFRSENIADLISGSGGFSGEINFSDDNIHFATEYLMDVDAGDVHGFTRTDLMPNMPNPFNPNTEINYSLAQDSHVNLSIYNSKGQIVRELDSGHKKTGIHSVSWDGLDRKGHSVATGVYLYILKTDSEKIVRKMLLLK